MNQRNRAHKSFKKSKTEPNKQKYITLRKQCQSRTRQAHKDYTENIFNQEDDKVVASKNFWSYVKAKKKDSCSVAPLRREGVLISDAEGKANILNDQYSSVFTKESCENMPIKDHTTYPDIPPIKININRVKKLLSSLKPS